MSRRRVAVTDLHAEEALAALGARVTVVVAVESLVVDEVGPTTEHLAALAALVGLDAAVGDDVGLQLVWPVERLRTACPKRCLLAIWFHVNH